mgnify:CR=1 FL=1
MILIDYAQSAKNEKIDVVSESYPHLEAGVIQDFKEIMKEQGYKFLSEFERIKEFSDSFGL